MAKPRRRKKPEVQKKSGVEAKFQDLTEMDNPTVIGLYGRPGTGKSTFLGTLPKPLLIIDIKDKGTDSAKSKELKRGDITVYELDEAEEIYEVYEWIMDNPDRFRSVAIDHCTALQDRFLDKVKRDEKKTQASQRMFGAVSGYMKEVIGMFKDLTDEGILPVFLSQTRTMSGDDSAESEDQLIPEVIPGLMPSVSTYLCAACRVVGNTYIDETDTKPNEKPEIEYRLRLGPNPYYITKVTRPKGTPCPMYLVDPNYDDLEKIIKGDWEEPRKKKPRSRRK